MCVKSEGASSQVREQVKQLLARKPHCLSRSCLECAVSPLLQRGVAPQLLKDVCQIAAYYLNLLPCHRNKRQTH